jgi:DNA polymerase II small subunit/DNA polymerase delta subunit B
MEYILFSSGLIIILISLFLTYRQNNNNGDDYYLQSELLSEIREIREDVKQKLDTTSQHDFQEIYDKEIDDKQTTGEGRALLQEVKDSISQLDEKIDRLENKINYSLSASVSSTKKLDKKSAANDEVEPENEEYQKIKELIDKGNSLPEAAQKLDMGTREVRLIWKFNSRGEE